MRFSSSTDIPVCDSSTDIPVCACLRRLFRSLRAALRLLRRRFNAEVRTMKDEAGKTASSVADSVAPSLHPSVALPVVSVSPIELLSTIEIVNELMRRCQASVIGIVDVQGNANVAVYGPGLVCRGLALQALATVDREIAKAQSALDEGSQP